MQSKSKTVSHSELKQKKEKKNYPKNHMEPQGSQRAKNTEQKLWFWRGYHFRAIVIKHRRTRKPMRHN